MLGSWEGCSGVREGWHGAGVGAEGPRGLLGQCWLGLSTYRSALGRGDRGGWRHASKLTTCITCNQGNSICVLQCVGDNHERHQQHQKPHGFRGGLSVGVVLRFQAFSFETAGCYLSGAK
jgi:hypothetical protein